MKREIDCSSVGWITPQCLQQLGLGEAKARNVALIQNSYVDGREQQAGGVTLSPTGHISTNQEQHSWDSNSGTLTQIQVPQAVPAP